MGRTRNGVAEVAAVDFANLDFAFLHEVEEEAGHELVGIGASEMDVASGVASEAVAHVELEVMEVGRGEGAAVVESGHGVDAAGATYEHLGVVFGVEVDEHGAGELAFLKIVGAGHAGLLVHGDEHFERTVNQVGIGKSGQSGSHADAVVGAEGSSVGAHPLAVDDGMDRCGGEVETLVVALAYHIHVALEDERGSVLMAGSGGFTENHVADAVGMGIDAVSFGIVENELTYFLLLLGGAGDFGDFIENPEDSLGLKVFYLHVRVVL